MPLAAGDSPEHEKHLSKETSPVKLPVEYGEEEEDDDE